MKVSDKTALSHAAKTKKECKGIWSRYESSPRIFRGISGLVVGYIVAIDVTRVRFPADAHCSHEWGEGKMVR